MDYRNICTQNSMIIKDELVIKEEKIEYLNDDGSNEINHTENVTVNSNKIDNIITDTLDVRVEIKTEKDDENRSYHNEEEIKMATYSIVEFIEDNTIEAVPTIWVKQKEGTCAWPTTKNKDLIWKLIESKSIPNDVEYSYHVAKTLKTSESLFKAREMAKKGLTKTDIPSASDDFDFRLKKKYRTLLNQSSSFSNSPIYSAESDDDFNVEKNCNNNNEEKTNRKLADGRTKKKKYLKNLPTDMNPCKPPVCRQRSYFNKESLFKGREMAKKELTETDIPSASDDFYFKLKKKNRTLLNPSSSFSNSPIYSAESDDDLNVEKNCDNNNGEKTTRKLADGWSPSPKKKKYLKNLPADVNPCKPPVCRQRSYFNKESLFKGRKMAKKELTKTDISSASDDFDFRFKKKNRTLLNPSSSFSNSPIYSAESDDDLNVEKNCDNNNGENATRKLVDGWSPSTKKKKSDVNPCKTSVCRQLSYFNEDNNGNSKIYDNANLKDQINTPIESCAGKQVVVNNLLNTSDEKQKSLSTIETPVMSDVDFQKEVLYSLSFLKHEIRRVLNNQIDLGHKIESIAKCFDERNISQTISNKQTISLSSLNDIIDCTLPMDNIMDLNMFDNKISQDNVFRFNLTNQFMYIGENNFKVMIRRIMAKLFTDELLKYFSYSGKKGKNKFSELAICSVIFDAVKQQPKHRNVSQNDMEEIIKNVLAQAPFNIKRQGKKNAAVFNILN